MIGFIINCIQYERPFTDVLWFVLAVFLGATVLAQLLPNYINTKIKPVTIEKIHRRIRMKLYKKLLRWILKTMMILSIIMNLSGL